MSEQQAESSVQNVPTKETTTTQEEKVEPQEQQTELDEWKAKYIAMEIKAQNLERELRLRDQEREGFLNNINSLKTALTELRNKTAKQENTLTPAQQSEVEKVKKLSEDMITKARGVIFEKTKICNNQELQIATLKQQVASMREVLQITKELLEIRNIESQTLKDKLDAMEKGVAAEKIRQEIIHQKMDAVLHMNTELKTEYQTQFGLFQELKDKYTQRDLLQQNAAGPVEKDTAAEEPPVKDTVVEESPVKDTIVSEPAVMETAVTEATVTEPAVKETAVTEATVTEPAVKETTVTELAVKGTTVTEPAVKEVAVTEPATNEKVTTEPAAIGPVAKQDNDVKSAVGDTVNQESAINDKTTESAEMVQEIPVE